VVLARRRTVHLAFEAAHRAAYERHQAARSEAFYMRVAAPGDLRCDGAQLGVLVTRRKLSVRYPVWSAIVLSTTVAPGALVCTDLMPFSAAALDL
jgi:hypothetical protein